MAVQYVKVETDVDFSKPASRAFGTIGIIGQKKIANLAELSGYPTELDSGTTPAAAAVMFTSPNSEITCTDSNKKKKKKDVFDTKLCDAIDIAFRQSPGPSTVWAIVYNDNKEDIALTLAAKLDIQIIVLAGVDDDGARIDKLINHVVDTSTKGGDGKERIAVVSLKKGEKTLPKKIGTDNSPSVLTPGAGRVFYVAHHSDEDAAAAVAGTIAGYEPHISVLLKPVNIRMTDVFSDADIEEMDKNKINWLAKPMLIPGDGVYLGEGYVHGSEKVPYLDIQRTLDDVTFRLKARLIEAIGDLRITRAGMRSLASKMTAILEPLRRQEVIDDYDVFLPVQVLLEKDPDTRTELERQELKDIRDSRAVAAIVSVTYAGAIHRLTIKLKFT